MRFEAEKHPHTIDLTGRRFGRLTVIDFAGLKGRRYFRNQQTLWRCRCDCGAITIATNARLNFGWTKSCGCLQRQGNHRSHRQSHPPTPEYRAWAAMKTRCYNPKNKRWEQYGGRGIKVCDRWLSSFESFFKDMGPKPSLRHSLDRKNNNGNYCKSNCRWATPEEQNGNRDFSNFRKARVIRPARQMKPGRAAEIDR